MLNIQGIGFCFLHSDRERFNSEINVDRNANMSEWGLKMQVVPLTLNHRVQFEAESSRRPGSFQRARIGVVYRVARLSEYAIGG
jgi:hypothetical protein